MGILVLVVWGATDLTKRWRYQVPAATVATASATILCIIVTRAQIGFWKNTETLFRHALQVTDGNYVAHNNLGTALRSRTDGMRPFSNSAAPCRPSRTTPKH